MNKEFTRMQKLAGLMTEGLYTSDEKAPMEGMSSAKMTKKELKAKIKEMMLPEETPGEMAYAEMGSMDEASPEAMDRMAGLVPISSVGSLIDAARRIISALKEEGFDEVYATPFENDVKARKLIKMFGLYEYGRSQTYGLVLMKREI